LQTCELDVTAKKTAAKAVAPPLRPKRQRPTLRDVKIADPAAKDKSPEAAFPHLTPTKDPEIFVNAAGSHVDRYGILLSLSRTAKSEDERAEEIIGERIDSPAKLLKFIALDPSQPMMLRLDAAKAAAPYFDKKTPVAIESKVEDFALDMVAISALPRDKRLEILRVLRDLGVDLTATKA
jgi:hypothetical protein